MNKKLISVICIILVASMSISSLFTTADKEEEKEEKEKRKLLPKGAFKKNVDVISDSYEKTKFRIYSYNKNAKNLPVSTDGNIYFAETENFNITFLKNASVSVQIGNAIIKYHPINAETKVYQITVNEHSITFKKVWKGVDLQYNISDCELKENLIVTTDQTKNITFQIDLINCFKIDNVIYNEDTYQRLCELKPYTANTEIDYQYWNDMVSVNILESKIKGIVWIDPIINFQEVTYQDTFINEGAKDSSYGTLQYFQVEADYTGSDKMGFTKWDLDSIRNIYPNVTGILNCEIFLFVNNCYDFAGDTYNLFTLDNDTWGDDLTWNTRPMSGYEKLSGFVVDWSEHYNTWKRMNVTNYFRDSFYNITDNYMSMMYKRDYWNDHWVQFSSVEKSQVELRPYIDIIVTCDEYYFNPEEDTYIHEDTPTTNYGTENDLIISERYYSEHGFIGNYTTTYDTIEYIDTTIPLQAQSGDFSIDVWLKANDPTTRYGVCLAHDMVSYTSNFIIPETNSLLWMRGVPLGDRALLDDGKYKLIPEKRFEKVIADLERKFEESANDKDAEEQLRIISTITNNSKEHVLKSEFVRLAKKELSGRRTKIIQNSTTRESVPISLRKILRNLYWGKCQLSGFSFLMKNGEPYFEVHHINPVQGNHIKNLLVVSPNIHAQFTYANVEHYFDEKSWLRRVKLNQIIYPVFQIIDNLPTSFVKKVYY